MGRTIRLAALAGAALVATGQVAAGAPPLACADAVTAAARRLFATSLAILSACDRAVARGARPAEAGCLNDATVGRRRARAAAKPARLVARACSDGGVSQRAGTQECADVRTVGELSECLRATHETETEALRAVAGMAAAGRRLDPAEGRCAARAWREARRLALDRLRRVQRCKRRPEAHGVAPGVTCQEALTATLGRRRIRGEARIATACGARPFDLGPPCDRETAVAARASCALAAAEAAADGALRAQFPATGFCRDGGAAVEQRIDVLLAHMTLEEKLSQMSGIGIVDGAWRTPGIEGLGVPGFGMLDGPRGVSLLAGHATAFPVAMARGATWDPDLERRIGDAIADELRAKGASVLLAPTVNVLRHPRWGRAQETYGEDPFHLGRMGVGFVRGAQERVVASAKHFAANSIEDTRLVVDVLVDERTLREVYLPQFRAVVHEGEVGSVMAAYNKVNGHYCSESYQLLRQILKDDWGFRGFVESDWFVAVNSTLESVTAGLDIEMPVPVYYGAPLAAAVQDGNVSPAVIDDAVRRVLRVKFCFGLDVDPPVVDPARVQTPAHLDLALQAARQSIVLLKNEPALLPLDRDRLRSIAVVGPLAAQANLGDTGSSVVAPSFAIAPLDGIRAAAGAVPITAVAGPLLSDDDAAAIVAADVAIVVAGLDHLDEGEGSDQGGDRERLGLSPEQEAMIQTVAALNPFTVVVLEGASAITMPWLDAVPAVVMAWYPGQMGGQAIAEALFGDLNPSGRLPMVFPRAEQDLQPFDKLNVTVRYGSLHGYRWLDRAGTAPLFPFGFGRSYASFRYDGLRLERRVLSPYGRLRVLVDVTNTGAVAGDEVVQLYVGYPRSRVQRPVRDLRAFARVHLEPGETRTVPLEVRAADLAYWDTTAGRWRVEELTYRVAVGPSSRELPLEGTFWIRGR